MSRSQKALARNIKLWLAMSEDIKNQRDLAKKIGVDPSMVNRWLSEETWISPDNLDKLADALGVKLEQLFVEQYEIRPV
jgi:transcriptional regulator with XRE-family HTH domain